MQRRWGQRIAPLRRERVDEAGYTAAGGRRYARRRVRRADLAGARRARRAVRSKRQLAPAQASRASEVAGWQLRRGAGSPALRSRVRGTSRGRGGAVLDARGRRDAAGGKPTGRVPPAWGKRRARA
eukprot:scaffold81370_cov30-Tisochrysis_lutea.AAC.4